MALKTLKAGEKLSLAKAGEAPVTKVRIELSWITDASKSLYSYDFDACTLATKGEGIGKGVAEELVCYYDQLVTPFATSAADNRTGNAFDANGNKLPDEVIKMDLSVLPSDVDHVPVIANLHKAKIRNQSFADAKDVTATLFDDTTNEKLATGVMNNFDSTTTSVLFVMLNRDEAGHFVYEQVNKPYSNKTLENWFTEFGFDVE